MSSPLTLVTSPPNAAAQEEMDLVVQALHDPAAFRQLYERYATPVYRYLYSFVQEYTDPRAIAEDLTSQVFLTVLEDLPQLRDRARFVPWMFAIARSKVMNYFRGTRREVALDEALEQSGDSDILSAAIRQDQIERARRLIRTLSADDRELIRLRYVAELSFADMAQVLGRKEDAVKKALYRLLARLQQQLEEADHA